MHPHARSKTSPVMVYKVPKTLTHRGLYYHEHVPLLRMHYSVNTIDLNNLINESKPDVLGQKNDHLVAMC